MELRLIRLRSRKERIGLENPGGVLTAQDARIMAAVLSMKGI